MGNYRLGTMPKGDVRDAVHIAIISVEAGEILQPGEEVKMVDGKAVMAAIQNEAIGVVDPFLKATVGVGERFYLCLNPGSTTDLRHEWDHPLFPKSEAEKSYTLGQQNSIAFLTKFAEDHGYSYEPFMRRVENYAKFGDQIESWDYEGDTDEVFWNHYVNVTGIEPQYRGSIWGCCV